MTRMLPNATCSRVFEMNRSEQPALFHDSILDAIGSAILAAGGNKRVAGQLWPAMDSTSAAAKLRSCCNPDQAHKLSPEEILRVAALAKEAGDHSIARYFAQSLGYEDPKSIDPDDAAEQLQRQFIDSVRQSRAIADRLASLDTSRRRR